MTCQAALRSESDAIFELEKGELVVRHSKLDVPEVGNTNALLAAQGAVNNRFRSRLFAPKAVSVFRCSLIV